MKETIHIAVERYTTPEGKPTCSLNVETGDVCRFAGSRNWGFTSVCMLSGNDVNRDNEKGWQVPEKSCPVWEAPKWTLKDQLDHDLYEDGKKDKK